MLQIAIVVFREIFEIALIVGILTAATKKIEGRGKWILGGLVSGLLGSFALALFTDRISEGLDGMGQEFFNGLILISAAAMIGWTVLWMQKHARTLSNELRHLGDSVRQGRRPPYILTVVVFLSVLREGSEIVLFTYSSYISGTEITQIAFGLIFGILLGSAFGLSLYFGMLKTFGKYFFPITSWILILFASGLIMQGTGFWTSAELIPSLANPAIDLSEILPQASLIGKVLNIFFGYIDQPNGTQLIAYFVSLAALIAGLKIAKKM